jgi:hypothetical protein
MNNHDDEEFTTGEVELTTLREFVEKSKQQQEARRTGAAPALVTLTIFIDMETAHKLDQLLASGYASTRETAVSRLVQTSLNKTYSLQQPEEDAENLFFGN